MREWESDRWCDRFGEKVKKAQIHVEKMETKLVSPQKGGERILKDGVCTPISFLLTEEVPNRSKTMNGAGIRWLKGVLSFSLRLMWAQGFRAQILLQLSTGLLNSGVNVLICRMGL